MPQLKHTFTSGRMNKDLDERLVPNGEYTDGLNIQVGHSEGSDVGAIENLLGNTVQSALGLTNATVIGSIRHNSTNCIYWFITATGVDVIAEYNQTTDTVVPVVVDKNSILGFSTSNLITGVNIIDRLLFWTDNLSQPKKINIDTFKAGSTNYNTHTQVYSQAFTLADVKVIKRGPTTAPVLSLDSTRRIYAFPGATQGLGCGLTPLPLDFNFTDVLQLPFFSVKEIGDVVNFASGVFPNWAVNDIIVMSASALDDNNFTDEYEVRIKISAITFTTSPDNTAIAATIVTISPNITNASFSWSSVLEEEDPMFPLQYPRFAYRWKYADGEYSVFSPFTEAAFVPSTFEYLSAEAFNEGMVNNLRYLSLTTLASPPAEVTETEILYKDSNSTLVYKVETIPAAQGSYTIDSEVISYVIEANQLLRPWDNVPKTAQAQEVTGNRVLYGNYTQGYDMLDISSNKVLPKVTGAVVSTTHSSVKEPIKSIKTQRNYQVGIVYGDVDGRESPVFTSENAGVNIKKENAKKTNVITAAANTNAPSWATYFKYFIKDTAAGYYNLALDRFYIADDGNVWITFPSAERNKVSEGSYLNLKKAHDSDTPCDAKARYRVLDIQNQAPKDVVFTREFSTSFNAHLDSTIRPQSGRQDFEFGGPTNTNDPKFFSAIERHTIVRFFTAGKISEFYNVLEGGPTGSTAAGTLVRYNIKLDREISEGDDWVNDLAANSYLKINVYKSVERHKKEYGGKFFVKIHRDPTFDEYVVNPLGTINPEYVAAGVADVNAAILDDPTDSFIEPSDFAFADHASADGILLPTRSSNAPTDTKTTFRIAYAPHSAGHDGTALIQDQPTSRTWFDKGMAAGNWVKFDGDTTGTYYQIDSVASVTAKRKSTLGFIDQNIIIYKTITLTAAVAGTFTTEVISVFNETTSFSSILTEGGTILSSSNPAIFETEPLEQEELDIYYEATNAFPIADHAVTKTLSWFNCYSFGNGVESDRIRDDYNAPRLGKGVKVSAPLDEPYSEEHKSTGLIFSGIYNSTSGINKLNQFALAEAITKDLNPIYGSIQKLHTRDTDTVIFCEDKVLRVLSNKDALYNADGNANVTSNKAVLGQTVPFVGEFGISKNPESFASYGFRAYFSDMSRGVVLRLSRDGLTEISDSGMSDFFIDNLKAASTVFGSFDDQTNCYNITLNNKTAAFKENVRGWPTLKSFIPEGGISLNNVYYTFKDGEMWSHDNTARNTFYGGAVALSSVTFVLNDGPSRIKNFQTIAYEGTSGWTTPSIETGQQSGRVMSFVEKEGLWYNYIKGLDTTWSNATSDGSLDTKEFSVQGLGTVGDVEQTTGFVTMEMNADLNVSLQAGAGDIIFFQTGGSDTVKKIGECTAIAGSQITCAHTAGQPVPVAETDYIFFAKNSEVNTSGIVGYYARTKMEVTSASMKELFAVNAETFISS